MAGEHDFAPLSESTMLEIARKSPLQVEWIGNKPLLAEWLQMACAELRASRAAMRALSAVDGEIRIEWTSEQAALAWGDAMEAIRALVAHVGRGAAGEGR